MATDERPRAPTPVLSAKLTPPAPRPGAVRRDELVERLERAGPTRLRAIVAPAGWGKSELVAQWLDVHAAPVAHLRLDPHDVDAARCWSHLLHAVSAAIPVDVDDLLASARSPGVPLVADVVEPLLARLDDAEVTIVIEDLHLAPDVELEESLLALVDRRPGGVGVAVTSRVEPPLGLARRRVSDQVVEIRAHDLALGVDAARAVLSSTGVEVADEAVATLVERCEGWAAGVYLAGLALREADDPDAAVDRFAGDDRNVGDYLASEVLADLPGDDRDFLVDVSVLDQLDGELCDRVSDRPGGAGRLVRLADENRFVIPLDRSAERFRFHHLFRGWLLVELARRGPDAVTAAHRRAAVALTERGEIVAAVEHALESGDARFAYDVLLGQRLWLLDATEHVAINRWYRALPEPPTDDDAIESDLLRAWSAMIEGDLDTIDRTCARVRRRFVAGDPGATVTRRLGEPDLLTAYAELLRGRFPQARASLDEAVAASLNPRAAPTVAWLGGAIALWRGEPATARLREAHDVAVAAALPYPTALTAAYLALDAAEHGDFDAVETWADEAFAVVADHDVNPAYLAAPHAARAQLGLAHGDLDAARADCDRALELAERRSDVPLAALAVLVRAGVDHSAGDRAGAGELARRVARDLVPLDEPGVLGDRLEVLQRQLRLQQRPVARRPATSRELVEPLTDRELALLRLLPGDLTQRELGSTLHVSFNTVKAYNRQIYRKLGVSSRDEAIAVARASGLL